MLTTATPPMTQSSSSKRSDRKLSEVARHLHLPDGIVSTGWPQIAHQLKLIRMPLDVWQQGLVTAMLGKRESGLYACGVGGAVMSIPRQAGKTYTVGALAFAMCLAYPDTLILWTAHRARTHNETFRSMSSMSERPELKPHVIRSLSGSGTEAIEFANGSRILFGAREQGFGRGFAKVDVLVLDEAQILTEKAMEDMVPATNAAPNGLVLMMGTPPRPSDPGEVFAARREAALEDADADTLYVEMSADPGADPNDKDQWRKANPSYPLRTTDHAILRMRKLLGSVESFKREGLGIWDEKRQGRRAFGPGVWDAAKADPPTDGVRSFGVKFTADGSHVALAGAVKPPDGPIHVEAIKQAPMSDGTQWLVDFLVERKSSTATIAVDGKAGVGYLVNALRDEGVPVRMIVTPTTDQVITAHGLLDRGVTQGATTHSGQQELNDQATSAVRRKIGTGGGFGWESPIEGETVALLDAVTMAHYGARTTKRNPGRRQAFL